MFSVIYSTEENPIPETLLKKRKPKWQKILRMPLILVFDWKDEFGQLYIMKSWSKVIPKFFKRQPRVAIIWTPCFWSSLWTPDEYLLYCWLLAETTSVTKKKLVKKKPESASYQNNVRSNWPLIRLVCARTGLWSQRPRPKWTLIRQVPDHCPGKSALRVFFQTM